MNSLKEKIQELKRLLQTPGSFVQNSAWMFSSSALSIVIQIVFYLILARIYSPAVYGLFGIYNAYIGVLGNAATLGYNQAFVLPKSTRDFSVLLRLTIWIAIGICVLAALFFWIAGDHLLRWFHHEELGGWLHFVAPVALLMALDRILTDWAIRNKEFKGQMLWSTSSTLIAKIFNVIWGACISPTVHGLMWTNALQYVIKMTGYARGAVIDFKERLRDSIAWPEMKAIGKEYIDYPAYIHWGNVLNIFSNNLPAILLPMLGFTMADVGYYTNSLIVLDMPIRLLGAGVASVFLQKASEVVRDRPQELATHTWRLYKNMLVLCLFFLLGAGSLGESIYRWMLGDRWSTAGRVVEVLSLFYFFRIISSPLSSIFNVLRRERESFFFQVALAIMRLGALFIGALYTTDFIELMWIYSIVNAVFYFFYALRIFILIKMPLTQVALWTLGGVVLVSIAIRGFKFVQLIF